MADENEVKQAQEPTQETTAATIHRATANRAGTARTAGRRNCGSRSSGSTFRKSTDLPNSGGTWMVKRLPAASRRPG